MTLKIKASQWKEMQLKEYIYASVGMIFVLSLAIILLKSHLPPIVPFFYGKAIGDGQLTNVNLLFIAPGSAVLVLFLNLILSFVVEDVFLKKVLVMCVFLFTLLITITVFKIIFLVGFF